MAFRNPGSLPEKAKPGELLLVIHDFEARSNDELSLSKGDKIELVERDDEFGDGWYLGKHVTTGKNGLFPEVYTTLAPKPARPSPDAGLVLSSLATNQTSNIHPSISSIQAIPDRVAAASATPPPLNTTPPSHKTASVPNAALPSSILTDAPAVQRSISMIQHDGAEDSPVMNETLSVIDEHMTDMNNPRPAMHDRQPTNDSASEYSSFIDHRISYIAGQETDEEENSRLSEKEVKTWSPAQVAKHLGELGVVRGHCDVFREQDITGEVLLDMDQSTIFMKEFDLGLVGPRLRTWHKIKAFQDDVRRNNTSSQRKSVFTGDKAFQNADSPQDTAPNVRSANSRPVRASTNPPPVRQEFADPQPSPSLLLAQTLSRDSNSTPSSFTFKSALDSPSRPSAASIREFNHSRRHSTIDYGTPFGQHTPTEQGSPAAAQFPQSRASMHSPHKQTPSLDQNWAMGTPPASAGSRSHSSANLAGTFLLDRRTPDPTTQRASHAPSSSRDLDRGYKSGDELDSRKARNVLRKHRESMSAAHSRQSSYQGDAKSPTAPAAKRHSRFGSVDSIRDTMAAITLPTSKLYPGNTKGHSRNSSANEAIVKADAPSSDTGTPMVTKLEYTNKQPSMKIKTSSNRDSGVGLSASPRSPTAKSANKPRMGLRAISDAVTGNEKSIATSPTSVPSPVKRSSNQSPARTGSTTPSAASQSLDRESTDASSKGTSGPQSGPTPALGPRRKSKKETSAYIRGLEQKTPQEQLIDCDYSGWMKKKSSNIVTTWKPRLFVLRGRRLSYYYTEEDTAEKGLIDISSHRVLPADHDILTGIHATVTGAKSSPVSPPTAHTPTLAAAEAAAQTESSLQQGPSDATFIFKLVPPRSGLTRAVNFTKPTVHYFAVDNVRQGRLWMAALMKATIDRDETKPITTSYQLKTISLAKARNMKQRPPALMNLDEQGETVQEGPKSDETGLNIQGVNYANLEASSKRTGSLDDISRSSKSAKDDTVEQKPVAEVTAS